MTPSYHAPWSPAEDHILEQSVDEGLSYRSIAVRLTAQCGRPFTKESVRKRLFRKNGMEIPIDTDLSELDPPPAGNDTEISELVSGDSAQPVADRAYVEKPVVVGRRFGGRMERVLGIPDVHCPWHDRVAWRLMIKAARILKPDTLLVIGDFADMLSVTAHDRSPQQASVQFKKELEECSTLLDELDSLGATRKIFCEGNHETRAKRLAMRCAPGLYDTLQTQSFLKLPERGWEFYPYQKHVKVGKISYVHDIGACGKFAHYQAGAAFESSVVHGHTHRAALAYFGNAHGETHVCASMGWLGSRQAAEYMADIKVTRDWQLAFSVAYIEPNDNTHFQLIPVIDGRVVMNGTLITLDN